MSLALNCKILLLIIHRGGFAKPEPIFNHSRVKKLIREVIPKPNPILDDLLIRSLSGRQPFLSERELLSLSLN